MKYRNIEITVVTILLLLGLFSLLGHINQYTVMRDIHLDHFNNTDQFAAKGLKYNFYINDVLPRLLQYFSLYLSFIWVACSLPDRLMSQQKWAMTVLSVSCAMLAFWAVCLLRSYLLHPFNDFFNSKSRVPTLNMVLNFYGTLMLYQLIKHLIIWALNHKNVKRLLRQVDVAADVVWFMLLWGICLVTTVTIHAYWGVTDAIAFMVPCAFLVYVINLYWVIPNYYQKKGSISFWTRSALVSLVINFPLNGIYTLRATHNGFIGLQFFIFWWLLQMVVLIPLSLYIYQRRQARNAEINGLQTDLGTSNANLQYLRSQINPHFLFNALNTLYGTALIEQADKTGKGIQKLGDMMRFMLHENNQDRIPLSRELEYLHNYIDLQNMRLALSPVVTVDINIDDIVGYNEIAPMLLIPFIENAYKHGISLQAKSWINIKLYKKDDQLNLEVHNSIHLLNINNPERSQSGTGLQNIKQRLQLLYPDKHALVVRQNDIEFFIQLTLTL